MRKIDHIAIQVDNIQDSAYWYEDQFGCTIEYCDSTWALLKFENVKLALVVKEQHPPHIAFEVDTMDDDWPTEGKLHRDGSISKYVEDPSGNSIELIQYPMRDIHGNVYNPKKISDEQHDFAESDNCYDELDG